MHLINGCEFHASKIMVQKNQSVGMLINYSSKATIEDAVFVETRPKINQTWGRGLEATTQSETTLHRAFFSNNYDNGIGIYDANTVVHGYDIVVADTLARPLDNARGRGIHVSHAAIGNFTRTLVENNRQVGIYIISYYGAEGLRPKFSGNDILVRGTLPSKCFEPDVTPSCDSLEEYGDGLVALGTSLIELSNVHVLNNHRVGLWFYDTTDSGYPNDRVIGSPEVTVNGGDIRDNQYGINIRGDSVTSENFSEVACYENDKTVDGCYSNVELSVPKHNL